MTQAQQEVQFVEVTPEPAAVSAPISASVQIGVNMFTSLDTARILLDALEEVIPEIATINR